MLVKKKNDLNNFKREFFHHVDYLKMDDVAKIVHEVSLCTILYSEK